MDWSKENILRTLIKKIPVVLLLLVIVLTTSGCFWNVKIDENEVGLIMPDGVTVGQLVGPGRYTNGKWYSSIVQVNTTAQTQEWTDPDIATRDKQQIGMTIGITYRRGPSFEAVEKMWQTYRREATSDDALWTQVSNRIARVIKDISTRYSLDQMLGVAGDDVSRATVQDILFTELAGELAEIGATLVDVGINNISTSEAYMALLEQKAAAIAAVDQAKAETQKLEEELKQEVAQTEIDLEKARRARLVAIEESVVIEQSDRAYELQRLEALGKIFGDQDKVFFVPQGTDLTLILGGEGLVPIK